MHISPIHTKDFFGTLLQFHRALLNAAVENNGLKNDNNATTEMSLGNEFIQVIWWHNLICDLISLQIILRMPLIMFPTIFKGLYNILFIQTIVARMEATSHQLEATHT